MHYTRNRRAEVARIQAKNAKANMPPIKKWHCVYVVGCEEFEPIKVGRSSDIIKRMDTLQTGCPYQLKFRGGVFGPKEVIIWLEHLAHNRLDETGLRLRRDFRGEWFTLPYPDAVAAVERCAEIEGLPVLGLKDYIKAANRSVGGSDPLWIDRLNVLDFMAHGLAG